MGQGEIIPRSQSLMASAGHVAVGPNAGWSYVTGSDPPLRFDEYRIHLNQVLFSALDPFWDDRQDCVAEDVLAAVRLHELLHANGFINGLLDPGINPSLEDMLLFAPFDDFLRLLLDKTIEIRNQVKTIADHDHTRLTYPPAPCDLKLLPNPTPFSAP